VIVRRGAEYGVAMSDEFSGYDDSTAAPDEEAPLDGVAPDEEAPLDAPAPEDEAPLVDPTEDDESPLDAHRTGNPVVDDVLGGVEALDDLPVDEHVAVYERAHERLRGALDGSGDS
jgi:hypothetical protein